MSKDNSRHHKMVAQVANLQDSTHPVYQAARLAMAARMFAIHREEPESGYGRMADDLMCGYLMEVPTWLALDMLAEKGLK